MSAANKIENAAEQLGGKAKAAVGHVANNDRLVAEGEADQRKASIKKAGENVKDAITK